MFNMINFDAKQSVLSQLYLKVENERKCEVNKDVVEIFSQAIQTGSISHSMPIYSNTDHAGRCFNAALQPFVEGKKFLSNTMIFLLAKSCKNSTFNCIPEELFDLIKLNLFQIQSPGIKELTFGTFYSNQLSLEAKCSIQVGNIAEKVRGYYKI